MDYDQYLELRKEKINEYMKEGYTRAQFEIAIEKIYCAIEPIIGRYRRWTPINEWEKAVEYIIPHMYQQDDGTPAPLSSEAFYRQARKFLNKDEAVIIPRLFTYNEDAQAPPEEKMARYLDILAEITRDYLELSVDAFRSVTRQTLQEQKLAEQLEKNLDEAENNGARLNQASAHPKLTKKNRGSAAHQAVLDQVNKQWNEKYACPSTNEKGVSILWAADAENKQSTNDKPQADKAATSSGNKSLSQSP